MLKNITKNEARILLENHAKVIDIRNKSDFNRSHLTGSLNIEPQDIENILNIYPDKNTVLIVICASGIRSIAVAEMLIDLGYKEVYNLLGGYDEEFR